MIGLRMFLGAARGGGSFTSTPGTPSIFELAPSTENAGWVEIAHPAFLAVGSRTYFGYVDGSNGDVKAAYYDSSTHATAGTTVLHAALGGEGTADNHDSPAFVELPNGHILAAYCRHAGSSILMRDLDPDTGVWGTETSTDRGNQHDYPAFFWVGSDLWLTFRDTTSGQNANFGYIKSTWSGSALGTWTSATAVYNGQTSHTPYWRQWYDEPNGRLHVVITQNTLTNLGHFYIDTSDGTRHKSDGTTISASMPLAYADITPVVTATTLQTWGVTTDAGNPVFIYMLHGSSDNAIRLGRWSGSAWSTEEIVSTTNGQLGINQTGSGCALDPLDTDRVWLSKKVSGVFELYEYVKAAGVWGGTQLTSGSSRDQVWAREVIGSDRTVVVGYLDIDYTNDTNFGPGAVKGYGTG